MKEKQERALAGLGVFLGYASMIGAGIWRALRPKSASMPAQNGEQLQGMSLAFAERLPALPPPQQEEQLESLSRDTPGNAPLDRLARRAAFEQREEGLIQPGGGLADPRAPAPDGAAHPWTHESQSVASLLQNQALESERLTGWSLPMPDRLPVPTFTPAVMALGIVIFAMGLATTWYVCLAGASVFAVSAWRWVGELQGE